MYKVIAAALFATVCMGSSVNAAMASSAEWSSSPLEEIGVNYDRLLPALYNELDTEHNSAAFDWVIAQAQEGHIPCLYFRLRNAAHQLMHKQTVCSTPEMKGLLFNLVLCMMRIAVDIIDAQIHFAKPEEFARAYEIFLQKFKGDLFKDIMPLFERVSIRETFDAVRAWFEENKERDFDSSVWTRHVRWKSVGISTWGIEISPLDIGMLRSYAGFQRDAESVMHPRVLRPLILAYLNVMYETCKNWSDFLSLTDVVSIPNLVHLQEIITSESADTDKIAQAFARVSLDEGDAEADGRGDS